MNDNSSTSDITEEIVALFDKAESRIKELELLYEEGLFYHPVNQLRYAGFHIVSAIRKTDSQSQDEEWKRARRHCQRAIYDSSEMALVYCIKEVHGFQDDYKKIDITPTIPEYIDIVRATRSAQELLRSTDHASREEKFNECDECFETLKPLVERLNDARPELNKRMRQQRNIMLFTAAALVVSILGVIVTIAVS